MLYEKNRAKEKEMLRMLRFRQMTDRFEEVSPACKRTFDWIFHPPDTYPWDSFVDYLQATKHVGPYWIKGKAGSGKSTLMKYILEHQSTTRALQKWAGSDELLIVPFFFFFFFFFFFWNLGTSLQKSHLGLLRSLLHTILDKHPELIREAFPSLWEDWKASNPNHEPSYNEIKKGFTRLLNNKNINFKVCFVIDGVDEFEGDHEELSIFLRALPSPRIKAIVSSRPISACVRVFEDCPSLRLQDLTQGDIEIFVRQNLYENQQMVELQRANSSGIRKLVDEIREKAEGVVLWVKLVVRLLIEGIQNGDQVLDLQRRVRSLPRDLKDLYKRMLGEMEDVRICSSMFFAFLLPCST
jgi:hypothetical protein